MLHGEHISALSALYTIELAAEAIRGHRSAHSLATGPVIAEPANITARSTKLLTLQMHDLPGARKLTWWLTYHRRASTKQ